LYEQILSESAPDACLLHVRGRGSELGDGISASTRVSVDEARKFLDDLIPGWHGETASDLVKYFVYEPEVEKRTFYVYPPQPAQNPGTLEASVSVMPTDLAAIENAISVNDEYASDLVDYVCHRAFGKDSKHASSGRSESHLKMFLASLGVN